mmetsp:Transcript_8442/g.18184  ORF Transcript_8442/g.18184 Transcript_8442/m.18184 type:complete len:568 (-) Transcript_8442:949-2652(-)
MICPLLSQPAAVAGRRLLLSSQTHHRYMLTRIFSSSGGGVSRVGDDTSNTRSSKEQDEHDVSEEWIPPNRPLSGDIGESHVYARGRPRSPPPPAVTDFCADAGNNGDDTVELKLSDVDLETIDWDSLEVEPGVAVQQQEGGVVGRSSNNNMQSQPQSSSASDFAYDFDDIEELGGTVMDVEAYVNRLMAEADVSDDSDGSIDGVGVDARDMLQDSDNDEYDSEQEMLELNMLEEEIMKLEREEAEQAAAAAAAITSTADGTKAMDGLLDDDPTSLSLDDFIYEQAIERVEQRKMQATEAKEANEMNSSNATIAPDWLAARRSRLGQDTDNTAAKPVGMLTPTDADAARELDSEIPVIEHTLLTADEIKVSLSALGAEDIVVIHPEAGHNGTNGLGVDGLVLVTGRSVTHLRVMAESIVRNLRARGLQRLGVVGAQLGAEGGEDIGTTRRNQRRSGGIANSRLDDGWMLVDCGNYVVHLQDETTRRDIDLEGLWAGEEGRKLRSIDISNEDEVDDYVANNPVPDEYARTTLMQSASDFALPNFSRKGRGERWNPVNKVAKKKKGRRRT